MTEEAFIAEWPRINGKLMGWMTYRVRSVEIAEDLCSMAWIAAWETASVKEIVKLDPWVFAIAKNCLYNFLRHYAIIAYVPHDEVLDYGAKVVHENILASLVHQENLERLRIEIGNLEPIHKKAIVYFLKGKKPGNSTWAYRLYRAEKILRGKLK